MFFTLTSANEALPKVIEKYQSLQKQKQEVQKLEAQLNNQMSASFNLQDYVAIKQQLNAAVTKFYGAVEDLENTGVVLKSLE
ncbi:MAG: DUF2203 family protein, partial [Nitrososphaerota archaeon]